MSIMLREEDIPARKKLEKKLLKAAKLITEVENQSHLLVDKELGYLTSIQVRLIPLVCSVGSDILPKP